MHSSPTPITTTMMGYIHFIHGEKSNIKITSELKGRKLGTSRNVENNNV
jgi:hypothetical protein